MGQYFKVMNLDKKEELHPHCFGDGLKLLEFGTSGLGTMAGLALLLRQSTDLSGDIRSNDELLGSWASDRIAVIGDYDESEIYHDSSYTNISHKVVELLEKDSYIKQVRSENNRFGCSCGMTDEEWMEKITSEREI